MAEDKLHKGAAPIEVVRAFQRGASMEELAKQWEVPVRVIEEVIRIWMVLGKLGGKRKD